MVCRCLTGLAAVALFLALESPTLADEHPAYEYRKALLACEPSCYEKEVTEGPAPKVKFCGYLPVPFSQPRIGRRWGRLESSPANSPVYVKDCKFPKKVPRKWKGLVAQARKQLELKKGDMVTVDPDDDWGLERNDLDIVTARAIVVRLYSRNLWDFDRCRAGNPLAVCEGDTWMVRLFNEASYRLAEAKKLKGEGKKKSCRLAAWGAVSKASQTRTKGEKEKKQSSWKPGLAYATRYDGVLSEKEFFAKVDEMEEKGRDLFVGCGGPEEIPFEDNDLIGH